MKRTTIVLSAAALGGLSAAAFAGGTQEAPKTGWPLLLGYHPASLTEAAGGAQSATTPRTRILASSGTCDGLYDNGDANGVNGYSNFTVGVGPRRGMMDDFVVPNGETWTISEIHHTHVWDTAAPGSGTDLELAIWSDSAGTPFEVIVPTALTTAYTEVATGNTVFNRPEAIGWATYDPIVLDAGRYWFDAAIAGPENNFWNTANQQFQECWLNWDEFDPAGPRTGSSQFGVMSDVNWCLTGTSMPGPANQFGLKHSPRGDAALSTPGADMLVVSNIGSSGEDGVSVDLGEAAGGWFGHSEAPASGSLSVTAVGVQNGTPDTMFATAIATIGATSSITLNVTNVPGTTFTRNLYLNGALVSSVSNIPSGLPAAQTMDALPPGYCIAERTANNVIYSVRLDSPVTVSGFGQCDEIELIPDTANPGIEALTSANVGAMDTGDLTFDGGGLIMFGNEHQRLGIASLTTVAPPPGPATPTLRVGNLGAAGTDGVTIGLDNVESLDVTINPTVVNVTPRQINLRATGCFDDVPGSSLGRSSIVTGGGISVLQGDFADISSANTVLIELWNDGEFVASVQRPGGGNTAFFGTNGMDPFPQLIAVGKRPVANPCFYWQFNGDLTVRATFGGAPIGVGDEVRVLADQPDAPITALDSYSITSSLSSTLVITGESVSNPGVACGGTCDPTNGDNNGDGCVNFADVLNVIGGNWGSEGEPGIPGDSNCDGSVSFADILLILATWGEGCE